MGSGVGDDTEVGPLTDDGPLRFREGRTRGTGEAVGVIAAVVVLALGLGWWATRPITPRTRTSISEAAYVGSRSCGECHPGASAAHHFSGHAQTFRLAGSIPLARRLDGESFPDPEQPEVGWSLSLRDGELAAERSEGGEVARQVLEYALGSGRHAITFVTRLDPDPDRLRLREFRLSYFAHDDRLDITPGQLAAYPDPAAVTHGLGRDFPTGLSQTCLGCHATRMSARGDDRFDPATAMLNVDCERCHGPAGDHLAAARRGEADLRMPFGPGRRTAGEQLRLCGECHRLAENVPPAQLRADNPGLVRFQPVGLAQSACYTRSAGALSCTTCHDPHARTSRDRAAYEAACLSCHDDPRAGEAVCPDDPREGCLDCHMPAVEAARGMHFTDHWIRIREPAPTVSPPSGPPGEAPGPTADAPGRPARGGS